MGRRHPGLQRRRDTWHLRRRVPDELRGEVGKTEVIRSLKTHDYRLAVRRATVEAARIDEEFANARKTLIHAHDITDAEAERIAVRHFAERDAKDADHAARMFGDERVEALEANLTDLSNWQYGRDPEVLPPLQAAARRLVVESGLRVEGTPPGMWSLVGYIRRAEVELALRLRDRLEGRAPQHRDPMFRVAIEAVEEEGAPTVEALIVEFMADPGRNLSAKKKLDWGFSLRLLRETAGAGKPLRDVDRADLRRLRDLLVRMPANASKRYPDLTLAQAADAGEADGVEPMAATTINSHIGRVASFFRWAQREGHVARNVAEGLRVAKQVSAAEARMPFARDQLERRLCQTNAN